MGRTAASLLLEQLSAEGGSVEMKTVVLPTELRVRGSSRPRGA
jgi:DNA-binding LacI/PurR family transcriptional regulator